MTSARSAFSTDTQLWVLIAATASFYGLISGFVAKSERSNARLATTPNTIPQNGAPVPKIDGPPSVTRNATSAANENCFWNAV